MPAQPSTGARLARSAGLTVFLATGLMLLALVITRIAGGLGSVQAIAVALSTFAGAVACLAMLIDAFDLWARGRRMTAYSQKMFHSLVFVAVLVALGVSIIGRNSLLLLIMAPSLVIYFFIVRKPVRAGSATPRSARGATRGGPSRQSGSRSGSSGARQRRGGRKRR